ncbi:hypothetical protein K491DRAFT_557154, partial [Lophiostoma macrostomum CBS 122681]
ETPQVVLSQPQKRPFEDDAALPVSTPKNEPLHSDVDSPLTVLSTIASPSPLKSSVLQTTAPASSNSSVAGDVPVTANAPVVSSSASQPAKRRKLTVREKEEQRLEKEAKEKAKAEKKAQKEAEDKAKADQKAQKDEEKRQKDEEKRKKNEEREEKKRAKEFEQQQKEEEKRKKERSQMRLNAFFTKPKAGAGASVNASVESTHMAAPAPDSLLLTPDVSMQDADPIFVSPQKSIIRKAKNDYDRYFLPFQLPSRAIVAPQNRFMEDPRKLAVAQTRLDQLLSEKDVSMEPMDSRSLKANFSARGPRGLPIPSVVDIVERINGSSDKPIDLTQEGRQASEDPLELLEEVPMKYLHFPEDVRPPYYGTYTKPHTAHEASKLARNPLSRTLHEADYDYDSELEWEEPEEGEDLDSEGGDDLDEDGDDDMEGFLDDEDDPQLKRRLLSGDLVPVTTGLCWEDSRGFSRLNDGSDAISTEFKDFRMGFLLEPQPHAIDPFSTAYWAPEPAPAGIVFPVSTKEMTINSLMQPLRIPLTQRPANGMLNTLNSSPSPSSATSKAAKPPKRLIPSDQIPQFKQEVEGSDLTKIALIEGLKKKFPKLPKDALSNTLSAVAARVGAKEVDKRWVL